MASSANRVDSVTEKIATIPYKVKGSTHIYNKTHVCIVQASGLLVQAADTAGLIYVGQAIREADNSSGADAAITADVVPPANERYHQLAASGADDTWTERLVCFSDDITVALSGTTTNDVYAGRVKKVISSTKVLVDTADRAGQPAVNVSA